VLDAREEELMFSRIMSKEVKLGRRQVILERVKSRAEVVLDLGCGNGALTELVAKNHPKSFVIGLDNSAYFLSMLKKKRRRNNMDVVRADIARIPIKLRSLDSVIASSVLHEILHFKSVKVLRNVFRWIHAILKPGGQFIIFDHVNPGKGSVKAKLTDDLLKKLKIFRERFRPRKIRYKISENRWVNMSLRDFYDFITKASFLDSDTEMNETHTPFTINQLETWLRNSGFTVVFTHGMEEMEDYLKYYGVGTNRRNFPKRKLLLEARRSCG